MCRLRNIAVRDYQESVTTGQTHRRVCLCAAMLRRQHNKKVTGLTLCSKFQTHSNRVDSKEHSHIGQVYELLEHLVPLRMDKRAELSYHRLQSRVKVKVNNTHTLDRSMSSLNIWFPSEWTSVPNFRITDFSRVSRSK